MKNLFVILFFVGLSFCSQAQQQGQMKTLFNGQFTHHGFYGAPVLKISSIDGDVAILPGLKGAWTINRAVSLGIEGYGLAPTIRRDDIIDGETLRPLMGYGGFFVEPIIGSNRLLHLTVPVLFGAGWVGYIEDWRNQNFLDNFDSDLVDDEIIWVIEPGVNAELNVARFFRFGLGLSYRFTQNVELLNVDQGAFRGLSGNITLKFGRF